jgi:hypothetical protein
MEEIKKYVERLKLTFPNVLDSRSKTALLYNITGVPTTFIIDVQGRTIGIAYGLRQWMSEDGQSLVEYLLKESRDN